jgi:hypothetical protein
VRFMAAAGNSGARRFTSSGASNDEPPLVPTRNRVERRGERATLKANPNLGHGRAGGGIGGEPGSVSRAASAVPCGVREHVTMEGRVWSRGRRRAARKLPRRFGLGPRGECEQFWYCVFNRRSGSGFFKPTFNIVCLTEDLLTLIVGDILAYA